MTEFLVRHFVKDYENTSKVSVRTAYGVLASVTGIFCNILLFAAKWLIGYLLHSISVMADAFNNLSDAGSSIISLIGVKMAGKPADKEHPFGHGRIEYIAALIVAFLVMEVGFTFFKSAIAKIREPEELHFQAACGLSAAAVCRNTPPHLILHDEHSELFHLLAQFLDVIADDAVVDVHIGAVVEQIQGAFHIDFQSRGNMVGFFFVLLEQGVVQILKDGHILRAGVRKIFAINEMHTAVNDGFLHRQQTLLATHHKFAQGKDKVSFQGKRIILLGVVGVDVHGVDELGTVGADFDDLTFQPVHQRRVFAFGIIDNNIIVRHQKRIGNLTFCRETFARAGSAQNQAIRVFQLLAIHHNQVVGQSIQTVVQRFFSALVQFLRGKGDEDSRAAGGQSPLNFDLAVCQRQAAHQTLLLLEVQSAQVAVVLLGNTGCLKNIVFQFPFSVLLHAIAHVHHPAKSCFSEHIPLDLQSMSAECEVREKYL